MYFYILNLCLNTITSMIKTHVFSDFTDFQVPPGHRGVGGIRRHPCARPFKTLAKAGPEQSRHCRRCWQTKGGERGPERERRNGNSLLYTLVVLVM
jgi:hypothetical protein